MPDVPVGTFRDFLEGLSPHSFCVPCLARLYEKPAHVIRQELQPMALRLESQTGECHGCTETSETYRVQPTKRPRACEPGFYWVLPRALSWWIVAKYDRVDGVDWWMFPGYGEAFMWDDITEVGARVERSTRGNDPTSG